MKWHILLRRTGPKGAVTYTTNNLPAAYGDGMVGFMFVRRTVVLLPLPIRKRKGVTTTATKGVQVFDEDSTIRHTLG